MRREHEENGSGEDSENDRPPFSLQDCSKRTVNINDNFPNSASVRFGTDSAMTLYRVLCLVMRPASISVIVALCCLCTFDGAADIATGAARGRELGVPFDRIAGQFNAITDVRGVEVGHTTIVEEGGKLVVGKGPVSPQFYPSARVMATRRYPRLCIPSTATVK